MPRRQEAMKDVTVCEKLRGVDNQVLIRRCPNGETRRTLNALGALSMLRYQSSDCRSQIECAPRSGAPSSDI